MTYRDYFLYTNDYWNFERGFNLVKETIKPIKKKINGFNFNRYGQNGEGDPRPDPRAHISIRIDCKREEDRRKVEAKLDEIETRGNIDDWCSEENNQYDIQPMNEYLPVFHTAHETASACAMRFYEKISVNRLEYEPFNQNKTEYIKKFMPTWLKKSGFTIFSNINNSINEDAEEIAAQCAKAFSSTAKEDKITDSTLFTERLFHLFLNCICIYREELEIEGYIGTLVNIQVYDLATRDIFMNEVGQTLIISENKNNCRLISYLRRIKRAFS
jgi:hypothetical protein